MKAKFLLPAFFLTLGFSGGFSQSASINDLIPISGEGDDFIIDHARDNQSNLYLGGTFCSNILNFGTLNLESENNIPSAFYQSDIFVAKYSPAGEIEWAVSGGGNYADKLTAIAVDGQGNTWFTGYFASDIFRMDTFSLEKQSISGVDMFIGMLNTEGIPVWLKSFGSENDTWCRDICWGNNGDIYAIGEFTGDSMFFETHKVFLSGTFGFSDVFVLKLNPAGNVIKTMTINGDGEDLASVIAFRNNKVVLGVNHYSSSITFGSTVMTNRGMYDCFIGITDENLVPVEAREFTGNRQDFVYDLDISPDGDIVVAGSFKSDTLRIEDQKFVNQTSTDEIKQYDIFLAVYDQELNLGRSYSYGQLPNDDAAIVKFDSENNIILGGTTVSSTLEVGTHQINHSEGTAGYTDYFIVKIDQNGNGIWSQVIYSGLDDENLNVNLSEDNFIDISGNYRGVDLTAGTHTIENSGIEGTYEPFIASGQILQTTVNERIETDGLRIFPNPSRSVINILNKPSGVDKIQIIDLSGRIIREENPDCNEINVENLDSGYYILRFKTTDEEICVRMLR